jgi:hypothetical protein
MNLAIMDRNVIHAFGASDHADELERAYLLARDRLSPERAEAAAWQWARVCNVIAPTLANAPDVLAFIRTRFLNMDENQ